MLLVCAGDFQEHAIQIWEKVMKKRLPLDNGWMCKNGIWAYLDDKANLDSRPYAIMHFSEAQWQTHNGCYPEVMAIECRTNLHEFCMPPDAEYEIERLAGGEIVVRIFAKQMLDTPVLEWVFPNPYDAVEDIYKAFMHEVLTVEEVDAAIIAAKGNPYGSPPDVAAYLRYILKGGALSTFLNTASLEEFENIHLLMAAKAMDCTLHLSQNEYGAVLFSFCASEVAEKLTELSGCRRWALVV